jgi:hypothetical protein
VQNLWKTGGVSLRFYPNLLSAPALECLRSWMSGRRF